MSLRQRVLAYLDSHKGQAYCASCVAAGSGSNEKFVWQLMRYLSWGDHTGLSSGHKTCSSCGKVRLVVCAANEGDIFVGSSANDAAPKVIEMKGRISPGAQTKPLGSELDAHIANLKTSKAGRLGKVPAPDGHPSHEKTSPLGILEYQKRSKFTAESGAKMSEVQKKGGATAKKSATDDLK